MSDVVRVLPGFSVTGRMEHDPEGTHQLILTRHLTLGVPYEFREADTLRIATRRETARYEVEEGDVVFMSRGTRNLAWAIATVPDQTLVPVSFYLLRPQTEVDSSYLAWYLNQGPTQDIITQIRTGAGTPLVQRSAFESLPVFLPPLAEQRHIARLGELMAREQSIRSQLAEAARKEQDLLGRRIIDRLHAQAIQ